MPNGSQSPARVVSTPMRALSNALLNCAFTSIDVFKKEKYGRRRGLTDESAAGRRSRPWQLDQVRGLCDRQLALLNQGLLIPPSASRISTQETHFVRSPRA